ncbi:MAG: leucyl/phenylalanyl-tRNA--protein transferase [Deltaproteobacteria bacterium]|jgi:leucyl/phenylalanyl-tRNA--protein transferase|nr:leucyl/phenylalanyl-tRNA--protein transferase [Deltaproteobacteria bacterium]
MGIFSLTDDCCDFPPLRFANSDGLLAFGGDLSVQRLVAAYSQGIFPWYNAHTPILWWSPDPRCVLFPKELHIPASLKKIMRSGKFSFSVNEDFETVIRNCSGCNRPEQNGTWILPEMIEAYIALHLAGKAHSVEVWEEGVLAGGLYGVALGRVFFGESMFYLRPNASKAAVVWLVQQLDALNFKIIDCQQETAHMLRFGAQMVDRMCFSQIIHKAVSEKDAVGFWQRG